MKILRVLRTAALLAFLMSFSGPSNAYGACEPSILHCEGGSGCYYEEFDENGEGCWAHTCDGECVDSGCFFGGEVREGICDGLET